uniref:LRAT domain-containing protein n=1 Tax=Malurus cyaneus samueli TaxID=2593467 RepID=A0A8C5UKE5_9PASS
MARDKYYPNPGDLIEIRRRHYMLPYQHWALYVGGGYVVHVTDVAGLSRSSSRRAWVKKEPLKDVVGNDNWDVNNKYEWYRVPFPVEEIIRRAERWIGKEVPYRLLLRNCEHFVTTLRYGEGLSFQVRHLLAARCSPRGWDTACTLHGDSQGPGVGSRAALPLGCPQPLHLEGHCALSAP